MTSEPEKLPSWIQLLSDAQAALKRASERQNAWLVDHREEVAGFLGGLYVMSALMPELERLRHLEDSE